MKCEPIKMADGTVVLAMVKPGARLTERDRQILAEYAEFCRERARREQRKRNREVNR